MSIWSRVFGGDEYEDEEIVTTVRKALEEDPLVSNPEMIRVNCENGAVCLGGRVDKIITKDHIEGAVRETLRYRGLKFAQIVNDITVVPAQLAA